MTLLERLYLVSWGVCATLLAIGLYPNAFGVIVESKTPFFVAWVVTATLVITIKLVAHFKGKLHPEAEAAE